MEPLNFLDIEGIDMGLFLRYQTTLPAMTKIISIDHTRFQGVEKNQGK